MKEQKQEKKGLSGALKKFYGVGDCGFTLMSNIESYYFSFFLTNLAKFSLPMVTFITTTASAVDALLSWIYGAILNSIKPMKWGRYRSWLIAIPWLVPFLYAFQFVKIGDGMVSAVIIIIAAIASHVAWNFAYVANVSMISVAGKTPEVYKRQGQFFKGYFFLRRSRPCCSNGRDHWRSKSVRRSSVCAWMYYGSAVLRAL